MLDNGGSPYEAAYLSSLANLKVRVLCAPANIQTIRVSNILSFATIIILEF